MQASVLCHPNCFTLWLNNSVASCSDEKVYTWNAVFLLFLKLSIPWNTQICISRQCSLLSCFEEWDVITASVRLWLSAGQWPGAGHGQTLQTGAETCIGVAGQSPGLWALLIIRAAMMGNRQRTLYWCDIDESPLDWSHLWPAPGPDDHWGKVRAAFLTEYSSPVSLQ